VSNLPSLGALRTLEAVTRNATFSAAAEELGVTQSAVSQQMKELERITGLHLFRRRGKRVRPLDVAHELVGEIRPHLVAIEKAITKLGAKSENAQIVLSAPPGFAVKWLFPRLDKFKVLQGGPDIVLISEAQQRTLSRDNAEIVIEYQRSNYRSPNTRHLVGEDMFPVCSPDYLRTAPTLEAPQDLENHSLIYDFTRTVDQVTPNWTAWFAQAGVADLEPQQIHRYGQADMVVQAAVAGKGVALGRTALVADDIADGKLVIPFGPVVPSKFAYFLRCEAGLSDDRKREIDQFIDWLLNQAKIFAQSSSS
jgi:LysR family glycine cleavage system transcriptional activator